MAKRTIKVEAKVYDDSRIATTTDEVAGEEMMSRLVRELEHINESGRGNLADFATRLAENPAYAFEWSHGKFVDAARVQVSLEVLRAVKFLKEKGDGVYTGHNALGVCRVVRDQLYSDVLRAARSPERSTSQQSNLMKQEIASVKANLLETLDRTFDFLGLAVRS